MKVKIERLDDFGRGISFVNNKICFVSGVVPDEEVEIEIVKEKKNFYEAKLLEIYTKSKYRCEGCKYNELCGGCSLDHINLEYENKYKLDKVNYIIKKFSKIKYNVTDIYSLNAMNYRNKIVLHGDKGKLGLYNSNSHNIVEIDECLLVSNKINNIIKKLRKIDNKNIEKVLIRVSNDERKSLIDIKGKVNYKKYLGLSDVLIVNDEVVSNDDSIITSIGDVKYYVSSKSFFQINLELTKMLYDEIKKNVIKLKPKNILDLYCGTGSIGIYVCNGVDLDLVGIDNNPSNISDAFKNLELNKMKGNFILGDVSKNINLINDYDLVIVDPPRSGLDKKTINSLISSNVKNIIYVSCDPITLVRDLDLLYYKYRIISIKLFNMFPRTYHVECISVLERRNVEK